MDKFTIDFYNFTLDNDPLVKNNIINNPKITKEKAKVYANKNCKTCWGRGWVLVDFPNRWMKTQFCSCAQNRFEQRG